MRITKKFKFNNDVYNVAVYDNAKMDVEENGKNVNYFIVNNLTTNSNLDAFKKLFMEAGLYANDENKRFNAMTFFKRLDYLIAHNWGMAVIDIAMDTLFGATRVTAGDK